MTERYVIDDIVWVFGQFPLVLFLLVPIPFIVWNNLLGIVAPESWTTRRRRWVKAGAITLCLAPVLLMLFAGLLRCHDGFRNVPEARWTAPLGILLSYLIALILVHALGRGWRVFIGMFSFVTAVFMFFAWFIAACSISGVGP